MKKLGGVLKGWWMAFARALGWFNTRLLLSLVYLFLLGIPAIVLKLIRRDPLDRQMGDRESYWIPKEETTHSVEEARHQF